MAEVQTDLMTKRARRKSPVAASCHYFNPLFKYTQLKPQPGGWEQLIHWKGWGTVLAADFFFFQINARFLPHFAVGPLDDTIFFSH